MSESQRAPETDSIEQEGGLLDLLIVLAKHKWLVVGLPLLAGVLAAGYALTLPNIYTATTKILPPQQQSSASSNMMQQLGILSGFYSGAIRNPNDTFVGMLGSRTVADNLIKRFDLNTLFESKLQSVTRQQLAGMTNISAGRDGIITVDVDHTDPKLAADIANAYVDELLKLTNVLAVTEASQRRLFFERQLELTRKSLVKAQTEARRALQQGGLVAVEAQGRTAVETAARLRAEITVKEVQIGAMRMFAAEGNPELRRAQQEAEVLRRELARAEGVAEGQPSQSVSSGSPVTGIDNLGLLRNVKYYETMYELLAKQYEAAKLDEAKDSAIIQVLDEAVVPDRKSKPARSRIVMISMFLGGILALLAIFVLETVMGDAPTSRNAQRWKQLTQYLVPAAWQRRRKS